MTIGWWIVPAILNLILLLYVLNEDSGQRKFLDRSLREIGADTVGFTIISSPIWLLYFVILTLMGYVTLK